MRCVTAVYTAQNNIIACECQYLTRCTRGDARIFFLYLQKYLYAQNEISYESIQILF